MKKYYSALGKGNFQKAGRYVVAGQQEAYARMAEQWQESDKRQACRQRYEVKDVRTDLTSDSSAVSSCMLLVVHEDAPNDTVYRVVLLKKEGRCWKVNNGLAPR